MPGELWLGSARCGVEITYNTAVAQTRKLYFAPGSGLVPGGSTIRNMVLTGDRSQIRSARPGVTAPGGTFSLPVASEEILELLRVGLTSTPVVTTPGGGTTTRLHTYTGPGAALSSMTMQWHDGFRPWQATGVYANTLKIAGTADGENTFSGELFGAGITQTALTGSPTDRSPVPVAGWETKLYIDAVTGSDNYGTTLIAAADSVTSWSLDIVNNQLGRLYTAANTRAMQAAVIGTFDATGSLTFVASGARSLTEYNNFVAGTLARIRLMFGDNVILEGALTSFVTVDLPIIWTEFTLLGEQSGVRTYEASFGIVHDATQNMAARVRAQNARTAAFV